MLITFYVRNKRHLRGRERQSKAQAHHKMLSQCEAGINICEWEALSHDKNKKKFSSSRKKKLSSKNLLSLEKKINNEKLIIIFVMITTAVSSLRSPQFYFVIYLYLKRKSLIKRINKNYCFTCVCSLAAAGKFRWSGWKKASQQISGVLWKFIGNINFLCHTLFRFL